MKKTVAFYLDTGLVDAFNDTVSEGSRSQFVGICLSQGLIAYKKMKEEREEKNNMRYKESLQELFDSI